MIQKQKSTAATTTADEIKEITQDFINEFEHGTKVQFSVAIKIEQFSVQDLRAILSFISMSARNFYLSVAEKFNNKP